MLKCCLRSCYVKLNNSLIGVEKFTHEIKGVVDAPHFKLHIPLKGTEAHPIKFLFVDVRI